MQKNICQKIQEECTYLLSSASLDHIFLRKLKFLNICYININKNEFINKRAVYYAAVNIFQNQTVVDRLIDLYTKKFNCEMQDLFIKPGRKGFFEGSLTIIKEEIKLNLEGIQLIPEMTEGTEIECNSLIALIIEKESVFNRIHCKNVLKICGKGFPDKNTLKMLTLLPPKIKIFCLTDFDPHGLLIFLNYKKSVKSLIRIGIDFSDIFEYKIKKEDIIKLSNKDRSLLKGLMFTEEKENAKFLIGFNHKIEIEAIFNSKNVEINEYLIRKMGL
ncbi:hypothetical protein NUSPORA_01275 [Nucleospora cyclopteri]